MENHLFFGKTHYKWQFSIVMLNYQRVVGVINQPMDIFVFAWDVPFFFARFEARASRSQRNVRSWWVFHATKTWHLWSIDGQLDSCRTLRVTCAGMIPKFQCSVSGVLFSRHNTYLLGNTLAVNWLVIWTHWLDPGHCFLIWGWVTTYYCHHIWGIIIH